MEDKTSYAVFWKMRPSLYEKDPQWRQYSPWMAEYADAMELRNECIRNPRCLEVVVFRRVETFGAVEGSRFGGASC